MNAKLFRASKIPWGAPGHPRTVPESPARGPCCECFGMSAVPDQQPAETSVSFGRACLKTIPRTNDGFLFVYSRPDYHSSFGKWCVLSIVIVSKCSTCYHLTISCWHSPAFARHSSINAAKSATNRAPAILDWVYDPPTRTMLALNGTAPQEENEHEAA